MDQESKDVVSRFKKALTFDVSDKLADEIRGEEGKAERLFDSLQQAWQGCGIGPRHIKLVANKHKGWGKALADTISCVDKGGIVALLGPRGTGKTQLAIHAMRYAAEKNIKDLCGSYKQLYPKCMTATEFFMEVKRTYDNSRTSEHKLVNDLARSMLMVIDEIQDRRCSEWEDALLTLLVDMRYRAIMPTILIANQSAQDFAANVGDSIADRMNQDGGIIEMDWESFRRTEREG